MQKEHAAEVERVSNQAQSVEGGVRLPELVEGKITLLGVRALVPCRCSMIFP